MFTFEAVQKEIKRRHLDPNKIKGVSCSGCGVSGWFPFIGPFGHFADCLVSDRTRFLSFQLADGSFNYPEPRHLRELKNTQRERQGPIVIGHGDY